MNKVVRLFADSTTVPPGAIESFNKRLAELSAFNDELTIAIKNLFVQLNALEAVIAVAADKTVRERLVRQSIDIRKLLSRTMYELAIELQK
jgi:hypothetical protein